MRKYNNTVLVGSGNPDLIARFDYIRFRRPDVLANLIGADLSDQSAVSDAELLGFLGASADATP